MHRISKRSVWGMAAFTLKAVSLIFICYYLYAKLATAPIAIQENIGFYVERIGLLLPILLLLCLLNWSLEALKWKVLSRSVGQLSWLDSLRGVLSGLSLSMIVPIGIGDNLGRLGYIQTSKKLETVFLGYLGGFIQFFITMIFGLYGIFHVIQFGSPVGLLSYLLGAFGLFLLLIFVIIFVKRLCKNSNITKAIDRIMRTLDELAFHNLLPFIALSIFRYVVFVSQLLILLKSMDIGLNTSILMAGISWIFLCKTVIPAFNFLSDLGVREFSAVFFFSLYGISAPAVILPTLILWLINIFLPSLFGMYFIARLRLSKLRAQPI